MIIHMAPTGRLIQGDVLDCNKDKLESTLKHYDNQLYLKWNPKKRGGWGCWELRRRPETKSLQFAARVGNAVFLKLEYQEMDLIHHVADMPCLNYKILEWLKKHDTWKSKDWAGDLEYEEAQYRERQERKERENLIYNMMQYRSAFREYKELILSGENPHHLAKFWGSV